MDVVALGLAKAEARRQGLPTPLDLRRDFGLNPTMTPAQLGVGINAAVQVAISSGRPLSLGHEGWPVDRAIVIDGPMTLCSEGLFGDFGAQNYSANKTTSATPLIGGRIIQTAPATDGFLISAAGTAVHIRDVGVQFDPSIAYLNTGHGFRALPPNRDSQTYPRHGLFYSQWKNLWVHGHDGNHYAFDVTNGILNVFEGLYATGGGGLHLTGVAAYNYGNLKVIQTSFSVVAGGTAHGVMLDGPASGYLNFISLDRVGVFVGGGAPVAGAAAPTSAQKTLTYAGNVQRNMIEHSTFETSVGSGSSIPPRTALGAGNYGLAVSVPENFAAGSVATNSSGSNFLMLTTITLNPTGSADATAYVEVSQALAMTSPVELARVTAKAGDVPGSQSVLPFTILSDYRYWRVTCTNATITYSHSLPIGTVSIP